jgi:hypothetical protein
MTLPAGGEERHPEHAGQRTDDPEAHRDLFFVPAAQLKVVVERRHPEDPLAAELVATHLDDVGGHFQHENDSDQRQDQYLTFDQGDDGQHPTQR